MSEGVRPSKRSRKPTNAAEENRDKQGEPSARSTEGGAPAARHSKRLKTASRAGADQPLTGAGDTDMGQLSEDLQSPVSGNTQSAKYVGPNNSIKRDEYVRLLTQALSAMGYGESAAMLEEESGIPLHSVAVTEFRNGILAGNWDDVASFLDHVDLNEAHRQEAIFLVLRQQFLELLEKGDHKGALQCVRKRSNSFGKEQRLRVHELVSLALCTRTDELYERANWAGSHSNSRYELLNTMQDFMPASVMLPERRLETLLERVLSEQQTRCSWVPLSYFSLLSDGQDGTEQIPTETAIVLEEHTDEVWHVQFSHNGKFVASASKDHTAIIWEIVSPVDVRMKHRLQEHTEPLSFVAWSPDDSLLLTCSNDTSVKLWDTHTGVCKRTYSRHVEFVTSCAWLPDGERFVTGGMDKNMYMWNTKGEELECWEGSRINDLAISDDGAFLICLSADKKIRKYCFRTKKEDVIEEKESCTSLCLSQDSQHLLVNIASQVGKTEASHGLCGSKLD
eukprot:scaffold1626_cov372-Prasinococcus_capsulatus_cf.AAC.4